MATKTRWSEPETIQVGKDLVEVAKRFKERLADRSIDDAFLTECRQSIDAAEAAAAGQPVRLGDQKGATAALETLIHEAAERTGAVRAAIQRKFPDRKDLQKTFGVGGRPASGTMKNALAGIDAVLGGAAAYPTETAAARILPRDLDAIRTVRASILSADAAQESAKGTKKGGTASRDNLLRDITSHVDDILAAAGLEFVNEPQILEQFTAPIPSKTKHSKSPPQD